MSASTSILAEFKGFAISYDPKLKPFFRGQVLEDLRKIASVPLGRELLTRIGEAKPRVRKVPKGDTFKGVKFSKNVNVIVQPTDATNAMEYTQPGYEKGFLGFRPSNKPEHNNAWCHFRGGSVAKGVDEAAKGDGTGCVSIVQFTNAQIITSKGEPAPSYIVFAHELIHSLHHVTGTCHATDEEYVTTGIAPYDKEPMTENGFRASFGIKRRMAY